MTFTCETTSDIEGSSGNYLSEPGTYHLSVTDIHEGQMPNGKQIDGFCVGLSVLAGTTKDQEDKELTLTFFSPNMTHSEKGQEWSRKKQSAFLLAAGLIDANTLGGKVSVNLQDARGRQVIASVESDQDGKFMQLCFANIYHVDDPRASKFPKNAKALELIDSSLRKKADDFPKSGQPKREGRFDNKQLADL